MASSTATSPTIDTSAAKAAQAIAPRKRRRRTAATGAAEDCFTCRKRQVRCDRKRPYCSQCLEIGKDCSGYRTTLTWGVGVASRGKLRGLSLPIVNSKKAASANEEPKGQSSVASKPATSPIHSPEREVKPKVEESYGTSFSHSSKTSPTIYSPGSYQPTSPIPIPIAHSSHGWQAAGFHEHAETYSHGPGRPSRLQIRPNPLRRVHTTATASYEETMFSAPSTGSVSTFSDSDFPSPHDLPPTPESFSLVEPYIASYNESFPGPTERLQSVDNYSYAETPRSFPMANGFTATSHGGPVTQQGCFNMMPPSPAPATFSDLLQSGHLAPTHGLGAYFRIPAKVDQEYFSDGFSDFSVSTPSTWTSTLQPTNELSGFHHLPTRLQFLLAYYGESIAPILVACDDDNPYRLLVNLAASCPALQNGIAALALNNIRHKGFKASPAGFTLSAFDFLDTEAVKKEETYYQESCVQLFNRALQDPAQATHDSVLATLLIQCLLHLSDGGFSKFRTQLAGVRRLMSMRSIQNGFSVWVDRWFTWFDVMSATVSDRDCQSRSETLDTLDLSANIGGLEHLANINDRFFKLVARLGHLPAAVPGRVKQEQFLSPPTPHTVPTTPVGTKDFYSHDANGFAKRLEPPPTPSSVSSDAREEVWSQFLQVRTRLSSWVSNPHYKASAASPVTEAEMASTFHLSAVFKVASTIYAECLINSGLPSSSEQIQVLVSSGLRNLASLPLEASHFLLWPMLIIGSECVTNLDRNILRQRIPLVAPGFFFRHLTCLAVLEQVWCLLDSNTTMTNSYVGPMDQDPKISSLGARSMLWYQAMRHLESWV